MVSDRLEAYTVGADDCLSKPFAAKELLAKVQVYLRLKGTEDALRQARDELEQRVQARTEELAKINDTLRTEIAERRKIEDALQASKERYRILSELSSDYAFSIRVSPEGKAVMEWGSAALSRVIGYTIDELNTQGWSRLVFPEDLSIWDEQFRALLSNQAATREFRVLTKVGDVRWLRHTLRPEWDEDQGRVVRIYGVLRDVTEAKQRINALRESEERFRILSTSSPIGIFQTDAPGSVAYTNPMWQQIAGQTLQESLGSGWMDTITPEDQEMTAEAWRAFSSKGSRSIPRNIVSCGRTASCVGSMHALWTSGLRPVSCWGMLGQLKILPNGNRQKTRRKRTWKEPSAVKWAFCRKNSHLTAGSPLPRAIVPVSTSVVISLTSCLRESLRLPC